MKDQSTSKTTTIHTSTSMQKTVQREAKRKKIPCESRKIHEIQNLPNLCRNIDFEKFSPIGIRSEYNQKHNNTNINTDTTNRATRCETEAIPCESKKIHGLQNLCKDVDFEKLSPIGLRSEWKTPLSFCTKHAFMINNSITWWNSLVSLHKHVLTRTHDSWKTLLLLCENAFNSADSVTWWKPLISPHKYEIKPTHTSWNTLLTLCGNEGT